MATIIMRASELSHKADRNWFDQKREWSLVKDATLEYYLKPYLTIVQRINRPILLVDFFAGPGSFGDGTDGSPIILLNAAKRIADSGHPIKVLLVEQDPKLAKRLSSRVESYGGLAEVRNADSISLVDEIANLAKTNTTLLYVDPWSISHLHLGKLGRIYDAIHRGSSIELLFVFMATSFMRWSGACLAAERGASHVILDKMMCDEDGSLDENMIRAAGEDQFIQSARYALRSAAELDAIAGGTYWREHAESDSPDRLQAFVDQYCGELRRWFPTVCNAPVYADGIAKNPKYWIVFGTRYRPAVDLINRAIKQARENQAERYAAQTLFAGRKLPPELPRSKCREFIVSILSAQSRVKWNVLRWSVSESNLGAFTDAEINNEIKALVRAKVVAGSTGQKVDDEAVLYLSSKEDQQRK